MPIRKNPNIEMLEAVVERLGPLIDEVVFPGEGVPPGLLPPDVASQARVTTIIERIETIAHCDVL